MGRNKDVFCNTRKNISKIISDFERLFLDMLLFSIYCLRSQAVNTFFNLFRGVHESRYMLQKDNPTA